MPFKAGEVNNPSGRPIGAKNRVTKFTSYNIGEMLERKGVDPFEILATLAGDETEDSKVRRQAAADLASYIAPKLKHIEHAQDADNPFSVTMYFGKPKPKQEDTKNE